MIDGKREKSKVFLYALGGREGGEREHLPKKILQNAPKTLFFKFGGSGGIYSIFVNVQL